MEKKRITVYCASSPNVDATYTDAARNLGEMAAEAGIGVVCGAGKCGLMGALIDGALSRGGEAIGVIPRFMVENGWIHPQLTERIVTPDMHVRKETMAAMADGIIALPGGCGTLEELLEIITWRQLGLYKGNVVILDINRYYRPLIEMLDRAIDLHFMNDDHRKLWQVTDNPAEALRLALAENHGPGSFSQKIV